MSQRDKTHTDVYKNTNRHVATIHNTSGQLLRIHGMRIHSVRFMDLFCSPLSLSLARRVPSDALCRKCSHNVIQPERPSSDTGQHIHNYVCIRIHHRCVCVCAVHRVARKSRSAMKSQKGGRHSKRRRHVLLCKRTENTHEHNHTAASSNTRLLVVLSYCEYP